MFDRAATAKITENGVQSGAPMLRSPEQWQTARLCLSVLGVLGTASVIGVALSLYLVNHYPLLLVALSPLGRHVILVAPIVNPVALVTVLVVRRMGFYLASFYLGRALGPAAIPWIEARAARFGRFVGWLQRLFSRAPRLVVLVMTGPTVSVLAGLSGMRTGIFVSLATPSLLLRVLFVLGVAEWMREYLEVVLSWADEHWIPGTIVMVALVAIYRWRRKSPVLAMED